MNENAEIVHSLAKWKRYALKKYGFSHGEGLYTDMIAIRRDEDIDNIHSIYVDQWDWEKVITKEERTMETLMATVREIFKIIKHMQHEVWYKYPQAVKELPDDIFFYYYRRAGTDVSRQNAKGERKPDHQRAWLRILNADRR